MKMFYTCSIIVQMRKCPHPFYSCTLSPTSRARPHPYMYKWLTPNQEIFRFTQLRVWIQRFCWSRTMHARKSCKHQGKYLCQICGRSFELKKKMNKSAVDQFQYVIVTKRVCNLCVWSSGPFYMGKRARHVNAIPT